MRKVLLMAAMVLLTSMIAACGDNHEQSDSDQEEQVVPVETAKATKADMVVEQSLYGRLQPGTTTPVMVQNPGEITELQVANGDTVEADEHLATIQSAAGHQKMYAATAGEIAQLNAEEGTMVSGSDPLMVIADVAPMIMSASVTAGMRELLETGETYSVTIDDEDYDAELTTLGIMPDDTGLYPVEAEVEQDEEEMLPGMTAVMHVPEKRVNDTIIVPTAAVVTDSGETFVYVVNDDQAVKTDVTVQETQSDKTAVQGDVQTGDEVVVNGLLTLSDGMTVKVSEEGD
ncbi:efflux RND transporter periplasmic adaptor subunit [Lentibacillus lipolyticus]|nr:efflux RND transporter periplasmic adaptor subunit [Lentibacillus lipolyticus]